MTVRDPFNGKKFGVITTDDPWPYVQYHDAANGAAISAYPCMAVEELKALPIAHFAAENCLLVSWATNPMVAQGTATDVIRARGFVGKTKVSWLKNVPNKASLRIIMGIWFRGVSEDLIFATRGEIGGFFEKGEGDIVPRRKRMGPPGLMIGDRLDPVFWDDSACEEPELEWLNEQTIIAPRGDKHSSKPLEPLTTYLETFDGPILELFSRRARTDRPVPWTCVGLDTGYEITIAGITPTVPCQKCGRPVFNTFAKKHGLKGKFRVRTCENLHEVPLDPSHWVPGAEWKTAPIDVPIMPEPTRQERKQKARDKAAAKKAATVIVVPALPAPVVAAASAASEANDFS